MIEARKKYLVSVYVGNRRIDHEVVAKSLPEAVSQSGRFLTLDIRSYSIRGTYETIYV